MRIRIPSITLEITLLRLAQVAGVAAIAIAGLVAGGGQQAHAAFPGVNGDIVFASGLDGDEELFVLRRDGGGIDQLTTNNVFDGDPAYSPDGTKVAFRSEIDGNAEIYVMNVDGTGIQRLTNDVGIDRSPAWSPDGSKIAFLTFRDGNSEIYTMNAADGSGLNNLTNHAGSDLQPAWSPDGSKIAFATTRDGNSEIYTMNAADGGALTNLTNNAGALDGDPDWSPDGTKIAFNRFIAPEYSIITMNANGSSQTDLTDNNLNDAEPSWSPDGSKIVYSRLSGNYDLRVMSSTGAGDAPLTASPINEASPSWQPLPPPALDITSIGRYALPKTCFEVRNASQAPLFQVCDNNFQGAPDTHPGCQPDAICGDDNPALGQIHLPLAAGDYRVVVSTPAPHHTAPLKLTCDATLTECALTAVSSPDTQPWFPWDVNGDGAVSAPDIFQTIDHFNQEK